MSWQIVESQCKYHREYSAEKSAVASPCPDKAILLIFNLLKMVLCSCCDGVPSKSKKKNGRAYSLQEQIIWAYWSLLELAGQYL